MVLPVPLVHVVLNRGEVIHAQVHVLARVLAHVPFREEASDRHEEDRVAAHGDPLIRPCDEGAYPWDPFPFGHHVPYLRHPYDPSSFRALHDAYGLYGATVYAVACRRMGSTQLSYPRSQWVLGALDLAASALAEVARLSSSHCSRWMFSFASSADSVRR